MKKCLFSRLRGTIVVLAALALAVVSSRVVHSQELVTGNQYVLARVLQEDGTIFIMLPQGRVGLDPQLNFYDKSFFSAQIGGTVFTNNNVITPIPSNTKKLLTADSVYKIQDTITFVWANRNGVDIIQELWPVVLNTINPCGQIVMRWKFRTLDTSSVTPVACQWLNDLDISDPRDKRNYSSTSPPFSQGNGTDGPIVLLPNGYISAGTFHAQWQQYSGASIPWFYDAPLFPLPGPKGNGGPGISGFGFVDYSPLHTTRPTYVTIGDWYTMAMVSFGHTPNRSLVPPNPFWTIGGDAGPDDAILMEFPATTVGGTARNKTVIGGMTSYGTLPFDECWGTMYGLLTYNPKIAWNKTVHQYFPTPDTVLFYAVNPGWQGAAGNAYFTLTGGSNLTVSPNPTLTPIGPFSTQPPPTGFSMFPGNVQTINWYLKVDPPRYFCNSDFISSIKVTGMNGNGSLNPAYIDPADGDDTCEHPIAIGCAETDTLPPRITSLTGTEFTVNFDVSDNRTTPIIDRGLKSITWNLDPAYPASTINSYTVVDTSTIYPCYNDFLYHHIFIRQNDSTVPACFDFKLIDCIGNEKDTQICFAAHLAAGHPDTIPPRVHLDSTYDCHRQIMRAIALEILPTDSGMAVIDSIAGSGINMVLTKTPFKVGDPTAHFAVSVVDSEYDGTICVHLVDAAKEKNHTDTCFRYCTTPDVLKPIVKINRIGNTHSWSVEVFENRPWDRRINQIFISGATTNIVPPASFAAAFNQTYYQFTVNDNDTTRTAAFCVSATDRAGNISDTVCANSGIEKDVLPPNIIPDKNPATNPTFISLTINDIHYQGGTKYVWDSGVDTVWLLNNTGIFTSWFPDTAKAFHCDSIATSWVAIAGVDSLKLAVIDSLATLTNPACITIRAKDCAGNDSVWEWCYPYTPDTLPPVMKLKYIDKTNIQVNITDDSTYDRGLGKIFTSNELNIAPLTQSLVRIPSTNFNVTRPNIDQSSTASISAIDYWGTQVVSQAFKHSAIAPVTVWVQDMSMKKGVLTTQSSTFSVPVYCVWNDQTPIEQKGITNIQFSFTINGSAGIVTFNNITTTNPVNPALVTPLNSNWTITPNIVGSRVDVTAIAAPGTILTVPKPKTSDDTLMYLNFSTSATNSTANVTLDIDQIGTEPVGLQSIIYNSGKDTTFYGLNSVSLMPPPWGSLSGSDIVILGACTPSLNNVGAKGNVVSLDEASPNPASHSTLMHYSLSDESRLHIGIYDMLGREVKTLVTGSVKQGNYDLFIDVSDLSDGQYTVRLESGSLAIIRKISVVK
ncbi:MAG TPA: T9SS type A sorting domain-containing protein [Candidatus Kapabacteria bacterium]|nr:T9SS type A sorting domain-containing protein [Candidatus Kapabacteria bacterium]